MDQAISRLRQAGFSAAGIRNYIWIKHYQEWEASVGREKVYKVLTGGPR